jgi:hypothetical protein
MIISLLGLGLLAACSGGNTPGRPRPEPSSTPPAPTRPRPIKLDGIDPCLIPQSDLAPFQIDSAPDRRMEGVFNIPECFYNAHFGYGSISLGVKEGIDVWLAGKYVNHVRRTTPVQGFPAINVTIDADPSRCDVLVDIAPHEYLKVSTGRDDLGNQTIPAEPCVWSHQWAEAAMSTLLAR